jgi:hypothetical protein
MAEKPEQTAIFFSETGRGAPSHWMATSQIVDVGIAETLARDIRGNQRPGTLKVSLSLDE